MGSLLFTAQPCSDKMCIFNSTNLNLTAMFYIVWRGSGITVPIFTFLSAYLMSFWYDDTRFGNYPYLGWTLLWAGILLTVQGAAVWGGGKPDPETGQIHIKKGHDFFFIPVLLWGLAWVGLSFWLINKEPTPTYIPSETTSSSDSIYTLDDERMVNIYNPYSDSMEVTITDLITKEELVTTTIPGQFTQYKSFDLGTYYVENKTLEYTEKMRVKKGERSSMHEYNELWYVLDGAMDLVLVDVTEVCDSTLTEEEIAAIDWTSRVHEKYNGKQMVEPYVKYEIQEKPIIIGVGFDLPRSHTKREKVYALIPVNNRNKLEEALLDDWVQYMCGY